MRAASSEQRVCGKLIDTAPKCLPILLAAEIVGSRSPELRGQVVPGLWFGFRCQTN